MSEPLDWNDLKVFLAVARRGSLGAGGRRLGQSQPTVGRRIQALEQALQRTLFQRTSRGLVLTEEGARLLVRAERIEEEFQGIRRQMDSSELSGTLRIGASEWFGNYLLAPVLAEFSRQHPGVSLELLTDYRLPSLTKRDLDLAFRVVPFEEPDVIARRLVTLPYRAYAAAVQGLSRPDGEGSRLILLTSSFDHLPGAGWLRERLPRALVAFRSNNREVQARLCASGAGIAVLPVALAQDFPELQSLDLGEDPPSLATWMGSHRDQSDAPVLKALIALVRRRLGEPRSEGP